MKTNIFADFKICISVCTFKNSFLTEHFRAIAFGKETKGRKKNRKQSYLALLAIRP